MKTFLWIVFFLICSRPVTAELPRFFDRITTANGLASNNVFSIWQDKKGYIWVGTSNGLQRYDGKYFLDIAIKKPKPLPAQPVRQILEDRDGNMWLRYGDQCGIFNPTDWSFQPVALEKEEIRFRGEKLWVDSRGNVYLLLTKNKLLYYNKEKKAFSSNNLPLKIPKGYQPTHLFEDPKTGFIWIACIQGMAVYDPLKDLTYTADFNPLHLPHLGSAFTGIASYLIDHNRNHRAVYWNPEQKFSTYSESLSQFTNDATSLVNHSQEYREMQGHLETRTGQLWYYGVNSLYLFDPDKAAFEDQKSKLNYSQINQIYEDREGSLWLASDEGIYHSSEKSPRVQTRYYNTEDPPHLFLDIKEIKVGNSTEFWIANWGRGILRLDAAFNELPSKTIYQNALRDFATLQSWVLHQERRSGMVWVGTQQGGLHIIDPETLTTEIYHFPIFRQSTIRSISQDMHDNIWFTTQRGDLIKYEAGKPINNASFELVRAFNSYAFAHLVDRQDRVWIATSDKGVYCLDAETGQELKHLTDKLLSSNKQEKIAQLNDSIFFFGHDLLNAYNDKSGENIILSYSEGLISNGILNMQVDQDGYLWIYTPEGLCRYNYFRNSFTQYPSKGGFESLEADGNGGTVIADGRVIFTGYESVAVFNPNQFNNAIKPDRPVLTSIRLFDQHLSVESLNTDEKRTFSHDKNAFTFSFSTLNFTNQEKLTYYHRLSGIDPEWKPSGASNMAVYSLLPPGDYTFEFRSENEEGISSPIGSFVFKVKPPFYSTWWFRTLIGALVLGIIILIYRLHINRLLAVINLRNRVARDLHDDMGSTLSTINILSSMAKTKLVTDPVKSSEYISKISDNSHRMMEAMDDIVWSIKPQNDSMEKVIARMREFANNVLEAKNIDFTFEVEEEVHKIKLPMDARRNFFLIYKEAVNNLAKYSKTATASITFSISKGKLNLRIEDYGTGFDSENSDNGNGLGNMKKRAEQMSGKLKIVSNEGEGTTVLLCIPI